MSEETFLPWRATNLLKGELATMLKHLTYDVLTLAVMMLLFILTSLARCG